MEAIVYLVQPFSRDVKGALMWDAPAWSRDRSFAVSLMQSLAKSKAGVIVVGVSYDASGELASEAEIVGGSGAVPTSLVLQQAEAWTATMRTVPLAEPTSRLRASASLSAPAAR